MMFRYGKIIESNSKTSRSDRFAEMSKQQQLIESKKQEIKAKFEERKRQEAEEALKKSSNKSATGHKSSRDHKSLISSRMQSWKNDDRWRKKHQSNEQTESSKNSNVFSNDGSFLEKYRKMAGNESDEKFEYESKPDRQHNISDSDITHASKIEENRHFLASRNIDTSIPPHENFDANCRDGIPYPPPPIPSSMTVTSQQQSIFSLTSHPPPTAPPPTSIHTSIAGVPASVPLLTAVPTSGASLQTVSLIQVPVSSSVILSCPLETTLVTSEPVVHLPVVHSTLQPNSITVPLQTTVIPAQIQITSQAAMPQSTVQTVQINQSSTNVILSQTLQPQSILVPSECIQSQQPLPMHSQSQPPPSVYNYSGQESGIPPVHLPPPNYTPALPPPPPASRRQDADFRGVPSTNITFKSSQFSNENDAYVGETSLITSESDDRYQNMNSPHVYERKQQAKEIQELETVAQVVADCGDDMENMLLNKYPDDEKLWFLKDKSSPPYIVFRNMVEKFRRERSSNGNTRNSTNDNVPCDRSYSRIPADDDSDTGEDTEDRRRRKRKRRSRWAPENDKIDIPPVPVPSNPPPNIGPPPGLNVLGAIPVAPPIQDRKLPGMSGPIISQVTRTDPALLQYAMKAFGTINLSEEDWKKAEDHYKINLLYQDMLKKRQELERLQAAGKHKYAYDSDEDTEGGTWEHKLRTQEMVATQLWADELTERSKGKHHIGDFLPPDELERFMEKYNALKQGREPDLSDYKEFKLREDNIGFQMLQKLGWSEGQGLGSEGSGIVNPVNKAPSYALSHGLGLEKPDDVSRNDDEYDAYRKRMMLAYRFRPNPLNNPRRPYY